METQFDLGEQPFTLTARERAAAGVAALSDAVAADEAIHYAGLVTHGRRAGVLCHAAAPAVVPHAEATCAS